MENHWSFSFPKTFDVKGSSLQQIPDIQNFDQFVFLANTYRNIFRNHFSYNAPLSYEESYSFLSNLNEDHSRVWYGVLHNEELIGHFGVKNIGDQTILLDNALRFSANVRKYLFKDINHALIHHIGPHLPDYKVLIIVKKSNKLALIRRHINWITQRPDLREALVHLVGYIKRHFCGIASAGPSLF